MRIAGNLGDLNCKCGPKFARRPHLSGLGGFGAVDLQPFLSAGNAATNKVEIKNALSMASTGASVGATVAALASSGSAAGPIGTAIGAVVGVLASVLKKKADRDREAWKIYVTIAGQAPGRAYDELPFELAYQGLIEHDWDKVFKATHTNLLDNDATNPGRKARNLPHWIARRVITALCQGAVSVAQGAPEIYRIVIAPLLRPALGPFVNDTYVNLIFTDWVDRVLANLPIGETNKNQRQAHVLPLDLIREICPAALKPDTRQNVSPSPAPVSAASSPVTSIPTYAQPVAAPAAPAATQGSVPLTQVGNANALPFPPVNVVPTATLPNTQYTNELLPVPVIQTTAPQKSVFERYGHLIFPALGLALLVMRS